MYADLLTLRAEQVSPSPRVSELHRITRNLARR